jgi:hypothetical protein
MKPSNRSIPLSIVDEHNQAFYYWFKARHDGFINKPLDLFHVDAHDDMGRPQTFRQSLFSSAEPQAEILEYYRRFVETELNIANFILPAVLAGLVRNIYFIYPSWRHFKPRRRHSNISSAFGEGRILKYGMRAAEGMAAGARKALPDLTSYTYFQRDIRSLPQNKQVILDIDLDYFACRDSVNNTFHYEMAITPDQFRHRDGFLADKSLRYSGLNFEFLEKTDGYYVRIGHRPEKEVAHLPPREEITAEIDALIASLQARHIRPQLVTITRSDLSGYCPAEFVESIQVELLRKLEQFIPIQVAG